MADQPEPAAGPRVAVIIPHLNQLDALHHCLSALASGSRTPDIVIVADNGSTTQPPADLWGVCPNTHLITVADPGPGPARNAAVAQSDAELIAFIDADCVPSDAWVEQIIAAHLLHPDAILGGDVRIGPEVPAGPVATYEAVYAYRMDRYIADQGFTGAGNMVVPRAIWADVGPFAGITIAEDRDWGHRATARGHAIRFEPSIRVQHPARETMGDLRAKWDRQIAHDRAFLTAGVGARLRWLAKAIALPLSPLAELKRLATTDRLTTGAQRRSALKGLVAIRLHRARRMLSTAGAPHRAHALAAAWNRP